MNGIVELYVDLGLPSEKLIYSGNNTIVDGFGEQMATLMTTFPYVGNVSYASHLLDTSNYTVQAMSFAKDVSGYNRNAHKQTGLEASGHSLSQIWVGSDSTASSYRPTPALPSFPSPLDTSLENGANDYGQNLNLIPYYSQLGIAVSTAYAGGCYAAGSGTNIQIRRNSTSAIIVSATVSSTFNQASCIDWRGFIRKSSNGNSLSGFTVSTLNVSTGSMKHTISLTSGDLATNNLYGGIFTIGLWGLDLESLICDGRMPPYSFDPINTLDYKLFAKKSLTIDITRIADNGSSPGLLNYQTLNLVWVLRFV